MFILTEKPSVAKDIASALGGFTYNKAGCYVSKHGDCIVPAAGHLLSLFMPEDYDAKYEKWSLANLPILPDAMRYKPITESAGVLKKIKECFKQFDASDFVLATDADREGELIGALILEYVRFKQYESARRFWVSEALTPEVVRAELKKTKPLSDYVPLKKCGYARQHADWLIGINVTQLLTCSTGKFFSFGRVQTAVLGAIYLRDRTISEFKSTPYFQYKIQAQKTVSNDTGTDFSMLLLNSEDNTSNFSSSRTALLDAARNEAKEGAILTVASVTSQKKTENPPPLFNITGLQKYCSKRYQMIPKRTLELAQELYEDLKCLSYPRTASNYLGDDNVELFKIKYTLLSTAYPDLAKGCVPEKIDGENKAIFNSKKIEGHHALIPLSPLPKDATEEQRNVYTAVLERFFAVIKKPYEYLQTEVKAKSEHCIFKTTGRTILQYGWQNKKTVSNDTENEDGEDNEAANTLPELREGDTLRVIKGELLEKKTQPKKHFTHATLLAMMENPKSEDISDGKLVGIGTPATRAGIVDELIKRQYIKQEKQYLIITDAGRFLIETVLKIPVLRNFISISTTTKWEQLLHDNPDAFLSGIKDFIKNEIPKITIAQKWTAPEKETLGICPECNKGHVLEGKRNYYCSDYKAGCTFTVWKDICGAKITSSDMQLLLTGKTTREKKMKSKADKNFSARLAYRNKKIEFVFKEK